MTEINRRGFLRTTAVAGLSAASVCLSRGRALAGEKKRRFTMDLVCGAIGVRADQVQAIDLAHRYGFESVAPSAQYLSRLSDGEMEQLLGTMKEKNLVWGSAGLPVDFRRDEDRFRAGLDGLPGLAKTLRRAGASRVNTWLRPSHDTLTYVANFKQHARRLGEIAKVLAGHDLRLGLEYVGPKTSWTASRHSFIHTMAETKELIAEIEREYGLERVVKLAFESVVAGDRLVEPGTLAHQRLRRLGVVPQIRVFRARVQLREILDRFVEVKDASSAEPWTA